MELSSQASLESDGGRARERLMQEQFGERTSSGTAGPSALEDDQDPVVYFVDSAYVEG
jgi:hypothetical protein